MKKSIVRNLIELHYAGTQERFKLAIVAPEDVTYGMSRMYGLLTEDKHQEIDVFRDMKSAANSLGVSQELLETISEQMDM